MPKTGAVGAWAPAGKDTDPEAQDTDRDTDKGTDKGTDKDTDKGNPAGTWLPGLISAMSNRNK